MIKSAFPWGTATKSHLLLDSISTDSKIYRDTLLKYFNKVVFESEVKSKTWATTNHHATFKALDWLDQYQIPVRGHVMVWPSWQHSPQLIKYKKDTTGLRAEILREIAEETELMKNRFTEWDVVNEPYAHHDLMDTLGGRKLMVEWFKAAQKNTPGVKLFLNDFSMFHSSGGGSDIFYENIKYLLDNGAPINAIGEQSHFGGKAPSINLIIERLNHFASLGLPIQVTEFDISSDDEDFKARYYKDFLTAVFSHPAITGIIQWGFWEGSHWKPASALWDKKWNIRPTGKIFTELVSKTWNTNVSGRNDINGFYKIRGFTGEYEITVEYKGKTVQKKFMLDNKGGEIIIKLLVTIQPDIHIFQEMWI